MRLSPGAVVGSYEVVAAIGAGGMGEVYRARDTRLHRDAAIKILPDAFARDPERLARFEREARTLAALNHPHVAQVYGVVDLPPEGDTPPGGGSYGAGLVMEFVDGEDLSQRIARAGAVPVDEAMSIALQVAEALEAAHAQGIIHRDLKPANIKVRADGQVKVLDFGLAKALGPEGGPDGVRVDPVNSPTITSPFQMSQLGVILGTAAYMAPEQARGKPIDRRADIWAFGCVLYEMLTAARAFAGEDVTDTLAAIVRGDADWTKLPADTPPAVRTLLRRCLEKDPRERLPDIGAARLELKDARASVPAPAAAPAAVRRRGSAMPWIVAAAATIAAIAAGAYAVAKRPTPDTRVYTASILVPTPLAGAPVRRLNISPDGRRLAFVAPLDAGGQPVLWVRPLGDAQAQPLRGTEGAGSPFWSADSRWIAFQADGKLKKVEAAGGTVTTVSDVVETPPGTWNADNVILMTGPGNVIVRVPASGGTPVAVTVPRPETGEAIHLTPSFLPDGRHFLYAGARLGTMVSSIYVASIDSKETTRLTEGAVPQYANGHLVFLRGSMLMAQPFDPDRLTLSGEARPLAERVQINTATGTGAFSVAQTGALVFQGSGGVDSSSRLLWVDRGGKSLGPIGEPGQFGDLQLSPDARWASATRIESDGVLDVWLFDVARNLPRRFTVDGKGGFSAVWHPDGKRIAYAVRRAKTFDLVERAMDGSGVETVLLSDEVGKYPIGYSPDGRSLVYMNQAGATRGRLWVLSLADRQPRQLFPSQEPMQMSAEISPDGRWIAYASVTEEGRSSLYVASFPGGSAKREIPAVRGAATPHWRRDGRELFFTVPGRFMAVDVDTSSAAAETGAPHVLFEVSVPAPALGLRSTYAPAPDAQRFVFRSWAESGTAAAPITLVLNWTQLLRQ